MEKLYIVEGGVHYSKGKPFKVGDKIKLTEEEAAKFPGKFVEATQPLTVAQFEQPEVKGDEPPADPPEGDKEVDPEEYTIDELKEILDDYEVDYSEAKLKADFIKLYLDEVASEE